MSRKAKVAELLPEVPQKYRITLQMDFDVEQLGTHTEQYALDRLKRDCQFNMSSFGMGYTVIKLDKTSIRQVKPL